MFFSNSHLFFFYKNFCRLNDVYISNAVHVQYFIFKSLFVCFLGPVLPQERLASDFNPTLMDRWHVTGCAQNKVFSGLINKLNERLVLNKVFSGLINRLNERLVLNKVFSGLINKLNERLVLNKVFSGLINKLNENYVSPRQGRETYCFSPCVCLSVCLSITNRVRSIT